MESTFPVDRKQHITVQTRESPTDKTGARKCFETGTRVVLGTNMIG